MVAFSKMKKKILLWIWEKRNSTDLTFPECYLQHIQNIKASAPFYSALYNTAVVMWAFHAFAIFSFKLLIKILLNE